MSINEFLVWLTGAGASVAASWLLEKFAWFQALKADSKQLVFFGVCLVLGLGSFAVQTYVPKEVLNQLAPWFLVVSTTFGAVFLGTSYHKASKTEDKPVG